MNSIAAPLLPTQSIQQLAEEKRQASRSSINVSFLVLLKEWMMVEWNKISWGIGCLLIKGWVELKDKERVKEKWKRSKERGPEQQTYNQLPVNSKEIEFLLIEGPAQTQLFAPFPFHKEIAYWFCGGIQKYLNSNWVWFIAGSGLTLGE